MPEPLHPPYLPSATQQPRTLDRWLDINSQNGPLTRTQTFITLPAFNQSVTWRGYSEIICAFNFEGTNGFSITNLLSVLPTLPNYALCIMYRDSLGVHRFLLWNAVGSVFYFPVALYTNQPIKKNFRLEVWSTNVASVTNTAPINLYTTVAGGLDYRYGLDSSLVNNDPEVTNFQNTPINGYGTINATDYWKQTGISNTGITFNSWAPFQGTGNLSVVTGTPTVSNIPPNKALVTTTSSVDFNLSNDVTILLNVYFVIETDTNNGTITFYEIGNTAQITLTLAIVSAQFKLTVSSGTTSSFNFPINQIVGIYVQVTGVTTCNVTAYNLLGVQIGTCSVTCPATITDYIQVTDVDKVYEIIHSNTAIDFTNYLNNNYTGWALPFVFPANSVPATN